MASSALVQVTVYALVGPSGTGKSHRATLVARGYDIELIIDDGLLINNNRILAGKSAKRESTSLAATRTAIFSDPDHAREVREVLEELQPSRLLILGTSDRMVERICSALELAPPAKTIDIEDVASADEIATAKKVRGEQGKHVIPAPTVEVKKSFSGYLIETLRLFHRDDVRDRGTLIEKSIVRPTFSSLGDFTITDKVIGAIARRAIQEVEGISEVGRVQVASFEDGVIMRLEVHVLYGYKVQDVMREAQRHAKTMLEHMTALNVLSIDITARRLDYQQYIS